MIYILLPVHNRIDVTKRFISSLVKQTYKNYHLVLIDDGSKDNTDRMVSAHINNVTIIYGDGNLWWAGSLQSGINYLKTRKLRNNTLILFINDDVVLDANYLENAVNYMHDKSNTILLSKNKDNSGNIEDTGVYINFRKLTFNIVSDNDIINCLSTRGLFLHWEDIVNIGNFKPKLLPHYLSDYEYTFRAFKKRIKCATHSDIFLEIDDEETGIHSYENMGITQTLRVLFSKKSVKNPYYWSIFILLCSERRWVPINLYRVWRNAFQAVFN